LSNESGLVAEDNPTVTQVSSDKMDGTVTELETIYTG
jgi:hypothetical protein